MLNKKYIALASVLFVGVIGLSTAGYYIYNRSSDETTQLSEAEKKAFFEAAFNGFKGAANLDSKAIASNYSNSEMNNMLADELGRSFGPGYDEPNMYVKTTTKMEKGKSIDECELFKGDSKDYESMFSDTIYEYYTVDGFYYSKYYTVDKDGATSNYYLTTDKYSISYMGGKYAERYTFVSSVVLDREEEYTQPIGADEEVLLQTELDIQGNQTAKSKDSEDMKDSTESIDYGDIYDGSDIELVVIDGQEYIKVVWKEAFENYCNPEMAGLYMPITGQEIKTEDSNGDQMIVVNLASRANPFDSEYSLYKNTEDQANLITRTVYETEKKEQMTLEEAQKIFSFDVGIEIRDVVNYPIFTTEDWLNEIRQNGDLLLSPSGHALNWISTNYGEMYFSSYTDRDFYPEGQKGDDLFAMFNPGGVVFDYDASYISGESYISVSKASEEATIADVVEYLIYDPTMNQRSEKEIIVSGTKIRADMYVYSYNSSDKELSSEESFIPRNEAITEYAEYKLIFEYKGDIYTVNQTIFGSSDSTLVTTFDVLNLDDLSVFDRLKDQVDGQNIENTGGDGAVREVVVSN